MITILSRVNGTAVCVYPNGGHRSQNEYYGKSTDTKPIAGVRTADVFYEMDTMTVYLFDEDKKSFNKFYLSKGRKTEFDAVMNLKF